MDELALGLNSVRPGSISEAPIGLIKTVSTIFLISVFVGSPQLKIPLPHAKTETQAKNGTTNTSVCKAYAFDNKTLAYVTSYPLSQ